MVKMSDLKHRHAEDEMKKKPTICRYEEPDGFKKLFTSFRVA
jgi:hypothetical protein